MWEGVRQISWNLETRYEEHTRHLSLGQPENSAVAEHIMGTRQYDIQYLQMAKVETCLDCLVNPFPVQFKSLVPGQKSRVFSRDI